MNNIPQDIVELSEKFGAWDLLTAYLMRSRHMSYEEANDVVYQLDDYLDHMLDAMKDEEEEI